MQTDQKFQLHEIDEIVDFYEKYGFAVIKNAIDEETMRRYEDLWLKHNSQNNDFYGWTDKKIYRYHDEIKDILCHKSLNDIFLGVDIGVALHVSLTDWASTEQTWHTDGSYQHDVGYQNYVGAYIALEEANLDSGPFEVVPGSHKWDIDYRKKYENGSWIAGNEWAEIITQYNGEVFTFLGERGDVLIWHGALIHRGKERNKEVENTPRKAIIGHYCNRLVSEHSTMLAGGHVHGLDMVNDFLDNKSEQNSHFFAQWGNGGYYYPICDVARSDLMEDGLYHSLVEPMTFGEGMHITWAELERLGIADKLMELTVPSPQGHHIQS